MKIRNRRTTKTSEPTTGPITESSSEKASKKDSWFGDLRRSVVETVGQNLPLFTSFAVIFILLTGFTLVNAPSLWWIPASMVLGALVLLLVYMNARVFIKIAITVFLLFLASALSFQIGAIVSPSLVAPNLWFASYWFSFGLTQFIAAIWIRGKSKWGVSTFSVFSAFVLSYVVVMSTLNVYIGALVSFLVYTAFFMVLYTFGGRMRYRKNEMPLILTDDSITSKLMEEANRSDWDMIARVDKKNFEGDYLTWKDRAFLFVPVYLEQSFQSLGRRRVVIGYKGKNANPWFTDQLNSRKPVWRSKNAPIMLVLLDLKNANGHQPKVVGVPQPDSKKRVAVGILPASYLTGTKTKSTVLKDAFKEFSKWTPSLSDKQKSALGEIGISDSKDALIEDALIEDSKTETDEDTIKEI